jgi:hypothetical protein
VPAPLPDLAELAEAREIATAQYSLSFSAS